jgi:hypothetical protein
MFAISDDSGASLSRARQLGTCSPVKTRPPEVSTAYLSTLIVQANPKELGSPIRIAVHNLRNTVYRDNSAVSVTPDGAFHPVWVEAQNGREELYTTTVHIVSARSQIESLTKGLVDITKDVVILYGGEQRYDAKSKALTVDFVLRNNGSIPIVGPIKVAVPSLYGDYYRAEISKAYKGVSRAGAVWDISSSVPTGTLAPGESSRPFRCTFFYLETEGKNRNNEEILGLNVRVFAGNQGNVRDRRESAQ